ncbi:hypothetical protein D9758_009092 [Tetrapyrgos nigripes]|uniref:Uncharacterized protein n=1 Tax=Tetrapyrgos nigripes TaxID=182062 RepID=A0A8H5GA71_9AGAR|nr:hypothetical protein D9758_009092 [Tetrapyrgos nigripes]
MPAQSWLLKLFFISATPALINIAQASTVTVKQVNIPPDNTYGVSPITSPIISNFFSYSEAGVKSDGSETTYVYEKLVSEMYDGFGLSVVPLPSHTTVSAEGTFVQSSGGFWVSEVDTAIVYEASGGGSMTVAGTATATVYQTCSLGSDGKYACLSELRGSGFLRGQTLSYTGATASDVVFTNVGELTDKKDNHAVGSTMTMAWQAMVVFGGMLIEGMLVL